MSASGPSVAVYLVTYRRHAMFRRALASVLAQTHAAVRVMVVNDDPQDDRIARIVEEFADPRVRLFEPVVKRGPTSNFNLAFTERDADFASLLEDDNWWEPDFLASMIAILNEHPHDDVVVGNERLWRETTDAGWRDLDTTIWPFDDVRRHHYRIEEICGSAKICNSSILVRTRRPSALLTPETIPVDVTEHFRERLLPGGVLLNGAALVNYAETLATARAADGSTWSRYQTLLIGSVFRAAPSRPARYDLARRLWAECRGQTSLRAVSLVAAGLAIREASALLATAPKAALARFALWALRKPARIPALFARPPHHREELDFLVRAPLTQMLARTLTDP